MTEQERIRAQLPDVPQEMIEALMLDAKDMICAYTRRASVPDQLTGALVRLTVILYNRMGTEGETSHSEGGVSRAMEGMPGEIEKQLKPYRLAVVVDLHGVKDGAN